MNFLTPEKQRELKRLLVSGVPARMAARAVGCAHNTASRYMRVWEISARCPCGKPSTHQGWCRWRVQLAPKRQEWMRGAGWAREFVGEIPQRVNDATATAQQRGHRLGPFVWGAESSASTAFARCVVCHAHVYIKSDRNEGGAITTDCESPEITAERQAANRELRIARRALRDVQTYLKEQRERDQQELETELWLAEQRRLLRSVRKAIRDPSLLLRGELRLDLTSRR